MADTKTSLETAATALLGPELFRGVQGGANVKVTATQIRQFMGTPEYVANNWYFAALPGSSEQAGTALSVTLQYMFPFVVREQCTIGALGLRTTTPGTSNVQMALYASDPAVPNRPGALLSNTASFVNTGAAGVYSGALGANQQVAPGVYWIALQVNDTTMVSLGMSTLPQAFAIWLGSATLANAIGPTNGQLAGLTIASVFGTWANVTGGSFTELLVGRTGAFAYQVVSIP